MRKNKPQDIKLHSEFVKSIQTKTEKMKIIEKISSDQQMPLDKKMDAINEGYGSIARQKKKSRSILDSLKLKGLQVSESAERVSLKPSNSSTTVQMVEKLLAEKKKRLPKKIKVFKQRFMLLLKI